MKLIFILMPFLVLSCSTIPKGQSVLKEEVREDKEKLIILKEKYRGKPIYVEVQSYPQLTKEGHVIQGGGELLKIGEEEYTLNQTLDEFYNVPGELK